MPEPLSVPVKVKAADELFEGLAGVVVKEVSGETVSTIHEKEAGEASTLPALSTARTSKV